MKHEIGHILGYEHEHLLKPQTLNFCQGTHFGTGDFDAHSIMNYLGCNEVMAHDTGKLSFWDQYVVAQTYGPPSRVIDGTGLGLVLDPAFFAMSNPDFVKNWNVTGRSEIRWAAEKFAYDRIHERRIFSRVYDSDYYLRTYNRDLQQYCIARNLQLDGICALKHFSEIGLNDGRQSSTQFWADRYFRKYPDLIEYFGHLQGKERHVQLIKHFYENGQAEGRQGL